MSAETIPADTQFIARVADAYEHLYDLVYLRTHPLLTELVPDAGLAPKEKAWGLHQILLEAIGALDAGPGAPTHSRAWRRHRLMALRYLEGLEVQAVADELGISKRHYFREHEAAIEAVAVILANARAGNAAPPPSMEPAPAFEPQEPIGRLELLRLEAARLARSGRQVDLAKVVQDTVTLAGEMARRHRVQLLVRVAPDVPSVTADHNTLRQILLGLLSHLLERVQDGDIRISAETGADAVTLALSNAGTAIALSPAQREEERVSLSMLGELAAMSSLRFGERPGVSPGNVVYTLELPIFRPRTILVVDDNTDALDLLQRYLTTHGYQVVVAQSGAEAIDRARTLQPYAITLDLMMPDRDGWDVLQTLSNHPATQHIPVIICTVLAAKEMALSLGAAAFLSKPLTERALLETLGALG